MKVFIDGKYYDEQDAKVSVFDHGLLYGDGVFEGIRAYNGRVFKLREHIDRLFYSAKAILLEMPMSHAEIMAATVATCRENNLRDGYIRLSRAAERVRQAESQVEWRHGFWLEVELRKHESAARTESEPR